MSDDTKDYGWYNKAKKAVKLPEPAVTWRCICTKVNLAHWTWCPSCARPKGSTK